MVVLISVGNGYFTGPICNAKLLYHLNEKCLVKGDPSEASNG